MWEPPPDSDRHPLGVAIAAQRSAPTFETHASLADCYHRQRNVSFRLILVGTARWAVHGAPSGRALPFKMSKLQRTPEGCQNDLRPLPGSRLIFVLRGCRFAQPPANGWQPFGLQNPSGVA